MTANTSTRNVKVSRIDKALFLMVVFAVWFIIGCIIGTLIGGVN